MQCLRHSHPGTLHHQIPALASKLQSSLITLGPRKAAVRRPQHGYSMNYKKKEGCVSCPIKTLHHSMYAPSIGQLTQPYGDGDGTTQPHAARTQRRVCMGLTLLSSSAAPANAHTTYPRSAPLTELPLTRYILFFQFCFGFITSEIIQDIERECTQHGNLRAPIGYVFCQLL